MTASAPNGARSLGGGLSQACFRAQLPLAIVGAERGSTAELDRLLDARLGGLRGAGFEEITAKERKVWLDTLQDIIAAAKSVGASAENFKDLYTKIEEIEAIENREPQRPAEASDDTPQAELSPKELIARARKCRDEGSAYFKSKKVASAIRCLERGLGLLQPYQHRWHGKAPRPNTAQGQLLATQMAMLLNLTLCYLQGQPPELMPQPKKAMDCCNLALELDPRNTRAMLRKSKVLVQIGQHAEAEAELARAARLEPEDKAIHAELGKVREIIARVQRVANMGAQSEPTPVAVREMPPASPTGGAAPQQVLEPATTPAPGCLEADVPGKPTDLARDIHQPPSWPESELPAPSVTLGMGRIQALAETIVDAHMESGMEACSLRIIQAVHEVVAMNYGEGAEKHLARVADLVRRLARGESVESHEPGKGRRHASAHLDGLPPEEPFYAVSECPWCSVLASSADLILEEFRGHEDALQWEEPERWGIPHRAGPCSEAGSVPCVVPLVERGVWVAAGSFQKTRALLSGIGDLRPCTVSFAQIPPHTEVQLHADGTNFVLGAHLCLDAVDGGITLRVGEQARDLRPGGVLLPSHTYPHAASNRSDQNQHLLSCYFYRPGVHEVERYGLQFLTLLLECLDGAGVEIPCSPAEKD